jgi:nucleoid-associated protein YgaU
LASLVGLFFLVGLLWISLYSDALFPRIENQKVSRTIQSFPIVRETRNETPTQDLVQEVRSMLTGEQPEARAEVKAEEPPGSRFPIKKVVKRGDNLYRLTLKVYGSASDELIEWVKQNNPRIRDGDQIHIGDEIVFPEAEQ